MARDDIDEGPHAVAPPKPDEIQNKKVAGFASLRNRAATSRLPARVQEEIQRRESSAEQLISWVQLSLVIFFSVLYSLAPRAEGSEGFNFVPLALGAYFLFTIIRLGLSYRIELPNWYLYMSVVVDVLLLVAIIFSFHIQYNQHPTFYLKTPTLMYIFLFISLRALRFDPRFIIATGLVGAAGWIGLVGYAILSDMDRMRITRNYVEYLTNNAILIGAELDKTIIILGVTGLLSVALYRARATFFDAIRDHAAAEDLKRFFAPEVAQSITDAEEKLKAGEGYVREAAILVVDVRSFTTVAAGLPPETVMHLLARYQTCVVPVIQRNGGRVDKFLGDGILATFGAVSESETHAADSLRAAQEIVVAIATCQEDFHADGWPGEFRIGVSVACGPVTVGVVGAGDRLEFTAIGDPVNLASKLEKSNKVFGTCALTTQSCLLLAEEQGYQGIGIEPIPGVSVEGTSEPIDLVDLVPQLRHRPG
ncbi:MAG: adenylate/guanylate cyclase domain-containing protein [Stappiaceae bacterium]